jgi:hypothetical protein
MTRVLACFLRLLGPAFLLLVENKDFFSLVHLIEGERRGAVAQPACALCRKVLGRHLRLGGIS